MAEERKATAQNKEDEELIKAKYNKLVEFLQDYELPTDDEGYVKGFTIITDDEEEEGKEQTEKEGGNFGHRCRRSTSLLKRSRDVEDDSQDLQTTKHSQK